MPPNGPEEGKGQMKRPILAATLLSAGLLTGCAVTTAGPPAPPPAPLAETIPNPPVTDVPLIWQPGHWNWTGAGYAWAPGAYVPQDGHGNMFMPGYWQQTTAGWSWVPAHWI
jgi:hypothetical protein